MVRAARHLICFRFPLRSWKMEGVEKGGGESRRIDNSSSYILLPLPVRNRLHLTGIYFACDLLFFSIFNRTGFPPIRIAVTENLKYNLLLIFCYATFLFLLMMDAIKKQASKLREQVAKQQHVIDAVRKQFSGRLDIETGVTDEADFHCYQNLRLLYESTRSAKHFQRDIVRGVDNLITVSSKQTEISTKLAEDCCKYGNENADSAISKSSVWFGNSHKLMQHEMENLLTFLGEQLFEPLRAMIVSAPLEDARHLTYRYQRSRHDVETQAVEVARRQLKCKEATANAESELKLQNAELRLSELRSAMSALGKEATTAMTSVETKQQEVTFQKLLGMVEAERQYHKNSASILDKLHAEMVRAKQQAQLASKEDFESSETYNATVVHPYLASKNEKPQKSSSHSTNCENDISKSENNITVPLPQAVNKDVRSETSSGHSKTSQQGILFIAEVIHSFDAQTEGELSLSVGDYVVVRKVSETGWSEGEHKGRAGWFPSAYVLHRDKVPASKVIEASP